MKQENNTTEAYMEIWTSIEVEVKALNRSKRRKRKFRKFLLILMPILGFGALWFTISNWDSQPTIFEDIVPATELKKPTNQNKIIASQKETSSQVEITNTPRQKNVSKKLISTLKNREVDKINRPINGKKTINSPTKIYEQASPVDPQNKDFTNPFNSSNESSIQSEGLTKNKDINTTTIEKITLLPLAYLDSKPRQLLPLKKINITDEINPIVTPIAEKKWTGNISISTGLSYADRQLQVKAGNLDDIIQYRTATERMLYATHFGLAYTLQHRSKIKFITGINFTTITEAYNLSQTTVDTLYVPGIEKIITYLDGTREEIYGNATIIRTTQSAFEFYHKYTLIEVPILVGFDKQYSHFSLGYQAGVLTNISLRNRGFRVDIEGTKQEIASLGYPPSIGLGFYASLSLQKPISRKLTVGISPSIRFYPDISSAENLIRQRYKLYGLNLNLAYKL